jgi:hypothetical protein
MPPEISEASPSLVFFATVDDHPATIVNAGTAPDYVVVVHGNEPVALLVTSDLVDLADRGIEWFGEIEQTVPERRASARVDGAYEYDFGALQVQRAGGRFSVAGARNAFFTADDHDLAGNARVHILYVECRRYHHPNLIYADYSGRECKIKTPRPHPLH